MRWLIRPRKVGFFCVEWAFFWSWKLLSGRELWALPIIFRILAGNLGCIWSILDTDHLSPLHPVVAPGDSGVFLREFGHELAQWRAPSCPN